MLIHLNPCEFFSWDCLRDKVYNRKPSTEEELKENVRRKIANIHAVQLHV
jgi:hypothetical protein